MRGRGRRRGQGPPPHRTRLSGSRLRRRLGLVVAERLFLLDAQAGGRGDGRETAVRPREIPLPPLSVVTFSLKTLPVVCVGWSGACWVCCCNGLYRTTEAIGPQLCE